MKKSFGNPVGLLAFAYNYLRNIRNTSVEGGQASDVELEVVQGVPVTAEYVEEVRESVLPPNPVQPELKWCQIRFLGRNK
ncbi:MAG: hypothetical protein ACD_12C00613G0003 [uncultured bacterium]|nr:MAG: hypothetical protein ACD_12C00613G0003 [uncultured bacterium]